MHDELNKIHDRIQSFPSYRLSKANFQIVSFKGIIHIAKMFQMHLHHMGNPFTSK